MRYTQNKTLKTIIDLLVEACHVPFYDVCVLHHNDKHFEAYVHGTNWYGQHVYDMIMNQYNITEDQISITPAPDLKFFKNKGYKIEVTY